MPNYTFKLYLYLTTPDHPETVDAVDDLKVLLKETLQQDVELEIVNVLKNPGRALKEGVFVTPTLVKEIPPPPLRVVGDFTNPKKVLAALALI